MRTVIWICSPMCTQRGHTKEGLWELSRMHLRSPPGVKKRVFGTSQVMLVVKNLPANVGDVRDTVISLGWEDPLEESMSIHNDSDMTEGISTHTLYTSTSSRDVSCRVYCCLVAKSCWLLVIPWTVACQAPLFMGFPRQEYWSRLPFSSSGDLPNQGIEPKSPALTGRFFTTEQQE